ncbi:hypothetical protein BN000_05814 [Mycobacterium europaeum]|uniref:Uncharacterized protein n=1 Tax=Mycobacterium europaeum TaxID=761804 RepID=A0A0U1DXF7_9MYCO|nr:MULTISPECIES: hypothetical protein [Mycobacterium avium complex (MAC)]CQD23322.1 hypothetical protein BN000_05814 [Mycobacterium europaeum]
MTNRAKCCAHTGGPEPMPAKTARATIGSPRDGNPMVKRYYMD